MLRCKDSLMKSESLLFVEAQTNTQLNKGVIGNEEQQVP